MAGGKRYRSRPRSCDGSTDGRHAQAAARSRLGGTCDRGRTTHRLYHHRQRAGAPRPHALSCGQCRTHRDGDHRLRDHRPVVDARPLVWIRVPDTSTGRHDDTHGVSVDPVASGNRNACTCPYVDDTTWCPRDRGTKSDHIDCHERLSSLNRRLRRSWCKRPCKRSSSSRGNRAARLGKKTASYGHTFELGVSGDLRNQLVHVDS